MSILNNYESEYINNLIRGGTESILLDFKEEWYQVNNKNYLKGRFEFLKDCIAFLNVSIDLERYIIIGIAEDKESREFNICGTQEIIEENNIQQLIENYIEPFPQIEIITNFNYEGKNLNIIKIKKENRDQPYLFKKSFEKKHNNNFEMKCQGIGYIRRGSSTGILTRSDLSDLFYRKQRNIYGYFNINAASDHEYFNEMMLFLECMNLTLDKESLDIISTNNSLFKYRLLEIFNNLIIQGGLFKIADENNDPNNNDYICKLIHENKDDFEKMDGFLDGGEHSLIISLFCTSYSLYQVLRDKYFEYEIQNEEIIINFNKDNIKKSGYDKMNRIVNNCNKFILYVNKIKYFYNNVKILNIRGIKFDKEVQQMFIQSDIKFRVSEDVIPLLIEPLYEQSNKMSVALRELLQNAIDACKSTGLESRNGIIKIEVLKEENKDILLFSDNGVGMDLSDISNHYLTVGKSKKKSSDVAMVGKFGVGALSMFLIGKKVSVVTKKINEEFEYSFQLFEGNIETSDLKKIKVLNKFESYTRIKIELNKRVSSSDINKLKRDFNIEKWALSSTTYQVTLRYNNEEWRLPSIDLESKYFERIYESGSARVYMFDHAKYLDLNNEDKFIKDLLHQKNVALYNDIGVNVTYKTDDYSYLKKDVIPFIVIVGKTTEEEYKIELSRNSAQIGKEISSSIVKKIYNYNITNSTFAA
ncbi:ATP-binding protein [Paenibacillus sp. BIC5C1]|uniref:ATP-binding protein n=1 Tax=Paenibacillus sp. BIC5C1 TaxID=3078263 RepID=UPI0028E8DFE1|nr:ATP-binding protein [Paenibacillus sp. BIC5C1]